MGHSRFSSVRARAIPSRIRLHGALVSAGFHAAVLACIFLLRPIHVAPVRMPGSAQGTHYLLTYFPGRAPQEATASVAPRVKVRVKHKTITIKPPVLEAKAAPVTDVTPAAQASAQPTSTPGNDAFGSGDVSIALLSFFPVPKPDLTQLPHGTRGDVILDVVIDDTGKIVKVTMRQGLGHGVDESVIATVQQWTFHPATRNGQPVASEQELLFHYEHS